MSAKSNERIRYMMTGGGGVANYFSMSVGGGKTSLQLFVYSDGIYRGFNSSSRGWSLEDNYKVRGS